LDPLPRAHYLPSAEVVAPDLLGHFLLRRADEGLCGGLIVETEAYLSDDPACHGYGGLRPRNRSMYGPPGHAYVYLIYGMHFCFNAVCRPAGTAEAVLVRAIETTFGPERLSARRGGRPPLEATNGPAKLAAALDIDRRLDGVDLCDAESPLWIARNPERDAVLSRLGPVVITPRVGITKAADWPLRFYLKASAYVSGRRSRAEAKGRLLRSRRCNAVILRLRTSHWCAGQNHPPKCLSSHQFWFFNQEVSTATRHYETYCLTPAPSLIKKEVSLISRTNTTDH
jgi:DNA-3-methyladenine glycosylase